MRPSFIVAFLVIACLGTAAFADDLKPVRTISVSGQAQRKIEPDEAHLIVTIGSTKPKLADAKAAHDAKLKKIFALADKNGIDKKNLSTQSSDVQPYYRWENEKNVFKGYRVATTVDIKLNDTTKVGTVTEQLLAAGLEESDQQEYGQLLSSSYTISNPDKIRDDMLAEAIKNARTKAENMASAAGASIGRVYQLSEGEVPTYEPRPMVMMAMAKSADAGAPESVAPPTGEQELRSSVTVIYELKD